MTESQILEGVNKVLQEHLQISSPVGRETKLFRRALPGYNVRIVADDGGSLPEGRVGRVLVQGPSVMDGYFGDPELTAEAFDGKWLDTGDSGFFYENELFLYGRNKDLIIIRGRNYAPDDIEHSLEGVEGLRRGCWAAIGVLIEDDPGEELVVLVERARARDPDRDLELERIAIGRIMESTGLMPDKVLVLEPGTLPRTSSGKIRRSETRRLFLNGNLTPPSPVNALRLTLEMIRSRLAFLRRQLT